MGRRKATPKRRETSAVVDLTLEESHLHSQGLVATREGKPKRTRSEDLEYMILDDDYEDIEEDADKNEDDDNEEEEEEGAYESYEYRRLVNEVRKKRKYNLPHLRVYPFNTLSVSVDLKQEEEKEKKPATLFELKRFEVEVGLDEAGYFEGAGPSENTSTSSPMCAKLVLKVNSKSVTKKTGNKACLRCHVYDRVQWKGGSCALPNLGGDLHECQTFLEAFHEGLLELTDLKIGGAVAPEPEKGEKGKKGKKGKEKEKRAVSFSICLSHASLELVMQKKIKLLYSVLLFLRPDFFLPRDSLPSSAEVEGLVDKAQLGHDHLDLAAHTQGGPINTALLYAAITPGKQEAESHKAQEKFDSIPGLVPKLRPYQKRAVRWMLEREKCLGEDENTCPMRKEAVDVSGTRSVYINQYTGHVSKYPDPQYPKVAGGILADEMGLGKTVEVLSCILSNRCPVDASSSCAGSSGPPNAWKGCADCNLPQYICGPCVRNRAKDASLLDTQCKATLIICPAPILEQWEEELARHTSQGFLKVFTYHGQEASLSTGGSPEDVVTAQKLAEYDVVLTTYSVLAADIHKDADISDTLEENQRSMRHSKRYHKVPTPLTRLKWWRICLDEAQMVQSGTAKAATMALKLSTQYRWCVTGTPINRGLEDLFGLMLFLGHQPFNTKFWWNTLIQKPCDEGSALGFSNLTKLLQPSSGGIMWRTRKIDVKEDLKLQPQVVKMTNLELSPVERHFYKKQHQECYDAAMAALPGNFLVGQAELEDRPLEPREASKIFHKLLRLRQACCHPQVGSQGIRSLNQNKPLSMGEILDMLIVKAKLDAEDTLRVVIFSLNGLGSIFQLEGSKADAVKAYREALEYSREYLKSGIKTDALQRLHSLHNLNLLLKEGGIPGIAPTLRDSELESEAQGLRKEYLKNTYSGLILAKADFRARTEKVGNCLDPKTIYGDGWFNMVLFPIEQTVLSVHFVNQLKERLNDRIGGAATNNSSSIVHKFVHIPGLKWLLTLELKNLFEAREQAMKELSRLEEECTKESKSFIYQVSHCGHCRGELGTSMFKCDYCKMDDLLMRYEARIFSLRTQAMQRGAIVNTDDATNAQEAGGGSAGGWGRMGGRGNTGNSQGIDDLGRGARGRVDNTVAHADVFHTQSELEVVLEFIASIGLKGEFKGTQLKGKFMYEDFHDEMKAHLSLLENMRLEFKPARAYIQAQRQYVYSFDELEMAMMKMQLRSPGEDLLVGHEKYFKLYKEELVVRNKELTDEKIIATSDLVRARGTLRYLEGLKRASDGGEAECTICPVCQENVSSDTAVLTCGHTLCTKCATALITRSTWNKKNGERGSTKIMCPTCRNSILVSEIAYATKKEITTNDKVSPYLQDAPVLEGSYGSKIETVVSYVKGILREDPHSKILVFSEWNDVLDLLSHAFLANKVAFVNPKGTGASKAFKQSLKQFKTEGTSVLMLPVKSGSNGLNLIEAQHVILIEPLLDPAKEAQAFGRVDRIGQTKQTFVHRFIVTETVEEKVYKLAQQRAKMYSIMGNPTSVARARKKNHDELLSLSVRDIKDLLVPSNTF